jgi:hypothetical protein
MRSGGDDDIYLQISHIQSSSLSHSKENPRCGSKARDIIYGIVYK